MYFLVFHCTYKIPCGLDMELTEVSVILALPLSLVLTSSLKPTTTLRITITNFSSPIVSVATWPALRRDHHSHHATIPESIKYQVFTNKTTYL